MIGENACGGHILQHKCWLITHKEIEPTRKDLCHLNIHEYYDILLTDYAEGPLIGSQGARIATPFCVCSLTSHLTSIALIFLYRENEKFGFGPQNPSGKGY